MSISISSKKIAPNLIKNDLFLKEIRVEFVIVNIQFINDDHQK